MTTWQEEWVKLMDDPDGPLQLIDVDELLVAMTFFKLGWELRYATLTYRDL